MSAPIQVHLIENGEPLEVRFPLELGLALSRCGFVDVDPVPGSVDSWRLTPRSKVGALSVSAPNGGSQPVAKAEVRVAPKIRIERVLFLMQHAHEATRWRDDPVSGEAEPDLLLAVIESFQRVTHGTLRQGMLQGYRTTEEATSVVRGRIREADQLRRRFALPIPVEVRYDDYTVDIAENRILRAALEVCLRYPGTTDDLRHRLQLLHRQFAGVTRPDRPASREIWFPSRLNARYSTALRLAELILASASFELVGGNVIVTGFVLDLAEIFEKFVCSTLSERLRSHAGYTRAQDRWHLDRDQQVTIRPDLVWYAGGRGPSAVIDAKYKAEKPGGFPDADLYQLLAYCTALRLPVGHLVYAKGNEQGRTHVVPGAEVMICAHTLDLSQPPTRLLAQMDDLCARIIDSSTATGVLSLVPPAGSPS